MQYRDEGNNASTERNVSLSDVDEVEEINSEEEFEHSQFHHDMGYAIVQTVNKALDLNPCMKEKIIAPYHDRIQNLNKFTNHDKTTATMRVYEGEMSTTEDKLIGKLTEITCLLMEFLLLKPVST